MGRVDGKVAIVTGGASGLGASSAKLLIREGAKVVITDINEAAGKALADSFGDRAIFIRHDVSKEEQWINVIKETLAHFGRLDVLVNSAGVLVVATIEDTTLEDFRFQNGASTEGIFLGCKYALPAMQESGGGSIINISSVAGIGAFSYLFAYSAAKAAIRGMTKSIAAYCAENKNNIRCNIIYPGGIDTPMARTAVVKSEAISQQPYPDKKFGEPDDIGYAVLYFASDESKFISGSELVIDNATGCIWI